MYAATHDTFGEPAEVIKNTKIDQPNPAAGEALIRMVLSPIHNHDLWTIRGQYGYKPELPGAIGGSEALGIVEELGEGTDPDLLGKRIVASGVHGTWADYFVAPAAQLLPLPDAVPDEAGAQLVAMPFSALSLLETLKVGKDEWLIQTAANGAVGKVMVGLAKARGVKLLNLVRREEAAEDLRSAGVENVISTSDADWMDQARKLIGEDGAVSAIDSVGGETGASLTELLATDGELVVFGTATNAPLPLSSGTLILKHITVKGFWGSRVSQDMAPDKRYGLIKELVTLAATGDLKLETGGVFPLARSADAMTAALTPGRAGKIMLQP